MKTLDHVKNEIARDFFKNLVVIDDDCYSASFSENNIQVSDEFSTLYGDCLKEGILCHLQYYPKQLDDTEDDIDSERFRKYFEASLKVAEQSDILVLDWFLGLNNSNKHSVTLIKELINKGIFKFIVIYTAHAEQVESELSTLGFALELNYETETEDESDEFETATSADKAFKIFTKNNIYVTYLSKESYPNSRELFKALNECLIQFSPDLIHWAGLDLANKIDRIVPGLITRLPRGITDAFAFQSMFKDVDDELSRHFAGLFVQDLEENLKKEPPLLLNENYISQHASFSLKQHFESKTKKRNFRDEIKSKINKENIEHSPEDNFHNFDQYGLNEIKIKQLTSLMESYTLLNNVDSKIDQGTVLKNSTDEFLLCISPLCDLVRLKKDDKVSFLSGKKYSNLKKTPSLSKIQTTVNSPQGSENILWDFKDIRIFKTNEKSTDFPTLQVFSLDDWEFFGKLRNDVLYRIINRLYSHRSRVGVDQFDIIRQVRDEK